MSAEDNTEASCITGVVMIDPYKRLNLIRNPDGSISRFSENITVPPMPDPSTPVFFKDLTINPSNNTSARLYLPRYPLSKLPLIIFYQGGGFVLSNANNIHFHNFCVHFASEVDAALFTVNYRLAPEHRLPAAYDDAVEALIWLRTNASDECLSQYVDFSKCFLMGSRAGANIAYNVGLRVASGAVGELDPLKIKGMILYQPFVGGNKRTESQLKLANDKIFPLCVNDLMWELALPEGADRDHEYCNPSGSEVLEKVKLMGWRVMVAGCEGDPLFDRQVEFAKMMKEKGLSVERWFSEGGFHGAETPSRATYKNFIYL